MLLILITLLLDERIDNTVLIYKSMEQASQYNSIFLCEVFMKMAATAHEFSTVERLMSVLKSLDKASTIDKNTQSISLAIQVVKGRKILLLHNFPNFQPYPQGLKHLSFCYAGQIAFLILDCFVKSKAKLGDSESILLSLSKVSSLIDKFGWFLDLNIEESLTSSSVTSSLSRLKASFPEEQFQTFVDLIAFETTGIEVESSDQTLAKVHLSINREKQASISLQTQLANCRKQNFSKEKGRLLGSICSYLFQSCVTTLMDANNFLGLISLLHGFAKAPPFFLIDEKIGTWSHKQNAMTEELIRIAEAEPNLRELLEKIGIAKLHFKSHDFKQLFIHAVEVFTLHLAKMRKVDVIEEIKKNDPTHIGAYKQPDARFYINDFSFQEIEINYQLTSLLKEEKDLEAVPIFTQGIANVSQRNYRFQQLCETLIAENFDQAPLRLMIALQAKLGTNSSPYFFRIFIRSLCLCGKFEQACKFYFDNQEMVSKIIAENPNRNQISDFNPELDGKIENVWEIAWIIFSSLLQKGKLSELQHEPLIVLFSAKRFRKNAGWTCVC